MLNTFFKLQNRVRIFSHSFSIVLGVTCGSVWFLPTTAYALNATYYVSSTGGKDAQSGASPNLAWQTLNKVNAVTFEAGDRILFKAGDSWVGQLKLRGSGVKGSPIVIDSFGIGGLPAIDGNGVTGPDGGHPQGVVHFENVQYWEVSHLDITNKYGTETWSCGVFATNSGSRGSHIYTKNCSIHEITIGGAPGAGAAEKKLGGILYSGAFDDILIEGNMVSYAGRTGISTGGGDPSHFTGLVIRNNSVSYSAGDAIVLRGAIGAIVEHNVAHHCGYSKNGTQTEWSASIWGGWTTRDAIYQYNEAYNHFYPKGDGEGYDIDTYSYRTIFQYNYSHDNEGGFMLTMGGATDSSMLRYNISLNEAVGDFRGGNEIWAYNNIWARTDGITSALHNRYLVNATYVYNNIFYNPGGSVYSITGAKDHDYNLFYPSGPAEPHGIYKDPLFMNPPAKAPLGRLNITGLKLKPNSPAIDMGKEIPNNGGFDYWGNKVPNGKTDIGAQEFYDGSSNNIRPNSYSQKGLPSSFTNMSELSAYLEGADQKSSIEVYDLKGVRIFTGTVASFKQWQQYLEGREAPALKGMRVVRTSLDR